MHTSWRFQPGGMWATLWFLGILWVVCADQRTPKLALVVTLAGPTKLEGYFEWSCRSIAASAPLVDMLVFHENNQRLRNMTCAQNVKLINLGGRGFADLISSLILPEEEKTAATAGAASAKSNSNARKSDEARSDLAMMLRDVLTRMPRYLVEIKPMLGTLLAPYLQEYTHWSYSDPDIIWGNLNDWIDKRDLMVYDILSVAKNWDAARLYLRGQMTWHKNTPRVNSLWMGLKYFDRVNYALRIGTIYHLLLDHAHTGSVFRKNCYSAEGLYSQHVFRTKDIAVKIVGRAFDDFFPDPVVLHQGVLHRCQLKENITACVANVRAKNSTANVYRLPPVALEHVDTYLDEDHCMMHWLPVDARYCVAEESYDKQVALVQAEQSEVRLRRLGEVELLHQEWKANNEMVAERQVHDISAFFHFRHWDDFVATKQVASWSAEDCMVLYLRHDQAMAYEACSVVTDLESKLGRSVQLVKAGNLVPHEEESNVLDALRYYRKKAEVGVKDRKPPAQAASGGRLSKDEKIEQLQKERAEKRKKSASRMKQKKHLRSAAGKVAKD